MIKVSNSGFAAALYPLGAYYLIVPVADVVTRAVPFSFGNAGWRYALVGLTFTNLGTFAIGMAILAGVAAVRGNSKLLRAIAVLGVVGSLVLLSGMASFALDGVQLQAMASTQMQKAMFLKAAGSAFLAGLLGTIAILAISIGAWRAARMVKAAPSVKAPSSLDAAVPVYSTISGGLTK